MEKNFLKKEKTITLFCLVFTALVFVLLLIPKEEISESIKNSVIFCGKTVIPQLYLYLCFSAFLWETGIIHNTINAFPKYGAEIAAFTVGILSGFPTGAYICQKLYEEKRITKKRAEYILIFSNNPSISFVFGFGGTILGIRGALAVFLAEIIISVIYAIAGRVFLSEKDLINTYVYNGAKNNSFSKNLCVAIKTAVENMINICGFILFFSTVSMTFLKNAPLILRGMVELTWGISQTAVLPFDERLLYCSAFLGFCGLCIHAQISSTCQAGLKKYIFSKCLSAVLLPAMAKIIYAVIS